MLFPKSQAGLSLEGYAYYIAAERRKKPDLFVLKTLYERAVAEADRRRWAGEAGAEEALRSFWTGYVDILVCHFLYFVSRSDIKTTSGRGCKR